MKSIDSVIQGDYGPQGPKGPRGPNGYPGARGANGTDGEVGDVGPVGPRGYPGYCYNKPGKQGPPGKPGNQGEKVCTYSQNYNRLSTVYWPTIHCIDTVSFVNYRVNKDLKVNQGHKGLQDARLIMIV